MELKRHLYVVVIVIGLLLFGLSIATWSTIALSACLLVSYLPRRPDSAYTIRRPSPEAVLLMLFVLAYYGGLAWHGFTSVRTAVTSAFSIVAAYAVGRHVRIDDRAARPSMLILIAPFVGFAAYAVLSIVTLYGLSVFDVPREAYNVWDPTQPINGITFGMFAAAGLAIPWGIIVGRAVQRIRLPSLHLLLTVVVLFASCAYVNIVFENRTPFLASGFALVTVLGVATWRTGATGTSRWRAIAVAIGLAIVLLLVVRNPVVGELGIYGRFQSSGLDTPRYELWRFGLATLFLHPFGGRQLVFPVSSYAHNLWLDVANDSGLMPFTLLAAFFVRHIGKLRQLLGTRTATQFDLVLISIVASNFIIDFSTPTIQSSPTYFAADVFALALLANRAGRAISTATISGGRC